MTQALYRKYRPEGFDQVLGQEHIVRVLQGAISLGNISHAYLFFGSRGTGKTTIARIVARELGTSDEDTFEIDAASNRGIDDIRELREGVSTLPFNSKYKVYIIDEVHMLTKEAWNAMLKTLEEPPAHVIFILATTEIEKVPETIVSRCQVFTFKKPTLAVLRDMITNVASVEGFTITSSATELVALLGDGSFRDTHGILQKAMSFSVDKNIDAPEIETAAGAPSAQLVNDFLMSLTEQDVSVGLASIHTAEEQNIDMHVFLKLVLMRLRLALLLRYAPEMKNELLADMSEPDQTSMVELLKKKGGGVSSKTLEILLDAGERLKYAAVPTLPLELALIEIVAQK